MAAATFDPDVTITPDHKIIMTGSVTEPVRSLQLIKDTDDTLLGSAQITDTRWSYTQDLNTLPGNTSFTLDEVDSSGNTKTVDSPFSVITGIENAPYSTAVGLKTSDGSNVKFYSNQGELEYHGDFVTGTGIFTETGDKQNTFVFQQNPDTQTITNFHATGASHDTVVLPHADFAGMASLLHNTTMSGGSATIHDPNSNATLTLEGVTKTEMRTHHGDFSFSGSGAVLG